MRVLKSHRDEIFKEWVISYWIKYEKYPRSVTFDYVSLDKMQRGDLTPKSQAWLREHKKENDKLKEEVNKSILKYGMRSPLILVSIYNPHWASDRKFFWESKPFIVQTGNNRYQFAQANKYTHISSIVLGKTVRPEVFNYLQSELKLSDKQIDNQRIYEYFQRENERF
tara:strand:+ start:999 stop:1502 length:504 start_codon:yes stop_codon:yes gene_type:complete